MMMICQHSDGDTLSYDFPHKTIPRMLTPNYVPLDSNLKLTLERVCQNDERRFDLFLKILISLQSNFKITIIFILGAMNNLFHTYHLVFDRVFLKVFPNDICVGKQHFTYRLKHKNISNVSKSL